MSGLADEAQRLQDHMEQHYGVCLQASQWDAAIAALRQPAPDAGDMQGLVEERARRICVEFKIDPDEIIDEYGPVYQWCIPAYHIGEENQSLTDQLAEISHRAGRHLLDLIAERAKVAELVEGLKDCADQLDAGGGLLGQRPSRQARALIERMK